MRPLIRLPYRILLLIVALTAILVPAQIIQAQVPVQGEPGSPSDLALAPQLPSAPDALSSAFSSGPRYDSGWVSLAKDEAKTLTHQLGGDVNAYIVDFQTRNSEVDGINVRYFGGADFGASPVSGHLVEDRVGAYWRTLTNASITVYRRPEDTFAEQVRIRIWVDASPAYNSGWTTIAVDQSITLTHALAGNVDDYVVDMQFKNAANGINQRHYGGADFGTKNMVGNPDDRVGAYWRTLTSAAITIYRRPEDTFADQIRVRIWLRPHATYDSGWVGINPDQAIPLTHAIGGRVDDYQVIMDFKAADVNGINQRAYGGMDVGTKPLSGQAVNDRAGAYWRSLTPTTLVIYRRPEDDFAPQIRIRIFRVWHLPAPNYDSGWLNATPGAVATLTHNLGGDSGTYLVDMLFRGDAANGINQRAYGGMDIGTQPSAGQVANDRVGAYWYNLTNTSISVYRRVEDNYAAQVRIRIWKAPKPDYNSGWIAKAPYEAETDLTHDLGGNYQSEYWIAFDQRSPTYGINHYFYGGSDFGTKPPSGGLVNHRSGAYWRNLNDTTVSIYRRPEDDYAPELRFRIWRVQPADYSSGWVSLNQEQATTLTHGLKESEKNFLLQVSQWDTSSSSTNLLNQRHFGGADFGNLPPTDHVENDRVGSYWRSLTPQNLVVYRRPEDTFADYVMVRIWVLQYDLFIPAVAK